MRGPTSERGDPGPYPIVQTCSVSKCSYARPLDAVFKGPLYLASCRRNADGMAKIKHSWFKPTEFSLNLGCHWQVSVRPLRRRTA